MSLPTSCPRPYPVSIDGHPFLIDTASQAFRHESIPYLRPYFLTEGDTGEKMLNPDASWRRSAIDWSHGAGQTHYDRDASDRAAFRASKGVDVWTRWKLSLLNDVTKPLAVTNHTLRMALSGPYIYVLDVTAGTVQFTTWANPTSWTTVTGVPANATYIVSDGSLVFIGTGAGFASTISLIGKPSPSACTPWLSDSNHADGRIQGYALSRLIVSDDAGNLYNPTEGGVAAPTVSLTVSGGIGANTFTYIVSAVNGSGEHPSGPFAAGGQPNLSPTAAMRVSWAPITGAHSYKVYRQTNGGPFLLIANVPPYPMTMDVQDYGTTYLYTDSNSGGPIDGSVAPNSVTTGTDTSIYFPPPFWPTDFRTSWFGVAEGQGFIYLAARRGTRSFIYKVGLEPDGTALTVPQVALSLPYLETVNSIRGYMGFLVIGTSYGLRLATWDSSGDLTLGPAIPITGGVSRFATASKYVYFDWRYGLTDAAGSTGLGRLSLAEFTETLVPAYASDLQAADDSPVNDILVDPNGLAWFTASAGVYRQDTAHYVTSGTLSSGLLTFSIPDRKQPMYVRVSYPAKPAQSLDVTLSLDGVPVSLGAAMPGTPFQARMYDATSEPKAETIEATLTLHASADRTLTDTITQVSFLAYPAVTSADRITVPIILAELDMADGQRIPRDPAAEFRHIRALRQDQTIIVYTEGNDSYRVVVEDYEFPQRRLTSNNEAALGTCVVKMKTLAGLSG